MDAGHGDATSRARIRAGAALIATAGALAYANTLGAPFVFDDQGSLFGNPNLRQLWPPWEAMGAPRGTTPAGRPLVALSLALNYRISGFEVWSYRLFNVAIHLLAGLVLYGVVRRTLLAPRLRARFGTASQGLAMVCALLWTLHPLQTAAVTYMIQRAESLMALCYLLTLYAAIRAGEGPHRRAWTVASVAACALGMGAKEVMVTAPVAVALYDALFAREPMRDALRRRWPLYAGLAATWALLAALLATDPRGASAGFDAPTLGPLVYAKTQFGVLLHYLRLALWPHPLVLDYGDWPPARSAGAWLPQALVVAALLSAVLLALARRPPLGFCGVWFFLVLSPTSSFVPIKDVVFEHRVYLALAGPIAAAVPAVHQLLARIGAPRAAGALLAALLAATLGTLTLARNADYRSGVAIWLDAASKRPANWRAHFNLAGRYREAGANELARRSYSRAIELDPAASRAWHGRARVATAAGDLDAALRDLDRVIALAPRHAAAHRDRGVLHARRRDDERARADLERAVALDPLDAFAHAQLGSLAARRGDAPAAVAHYRQALTLRPTLPSAHDALARLRATHPDAALRDGTEAVALAERACRLTGRRNPRYLDTLAAAYAERGEFDRAASTAREAAELAARQGKQPLATGARERMALYQAGRPYRAGPRAR